MADTSVQWEIHANSLYSVQVVAGALEDAAADQVGPWLLFDSGTGNADFNQALVAGPVAAARTAVALACEWYEARGAPFSFWLRVPYDREVIELALASGFVEQARQPAMLLSPIPDRRVATELAVVQVGDEDGVEAYAAAESEEAERSARHHEPDLALARATMANKDVRLFAGFFEGKAVARSMVVVRGPMARVTNVYVAPSVRRRGFGEAITQAAIDAGMKMGATTACLEASEMGVPVYRRMGFREQYSYVRLGR